MLKAFALNGREVYAAQHYFYDGRNDLELDNLGHLQSGVHLLQIQGRTLQMSSWIIRQ